MSDTRKTPSPATTSSDARNADEHSRIRSRQDSDVKGAGSGEYAAVKPPDSSRPSSRATESMSERAARIDSKLSIARLLLERLPPLDGRARLLGSAILRRDEVLIDAVLAEMTDEVVALASSRTRR
ncbi:MAG TPA: hypothetical protein VH062_06350 [Polyangiaceae bacterium]|nr:hypothetical protein [Polyangiaceae bacterium]